MNEEKFTWAGLEPATSGLMCQGSTNWAIQPYIGGLHILSISLFGGASQTVWLASLTGAPEQRYWQKMETANIGLESSVGRAPARQSGGRGFKFRSSQFFFVHPNLSKNCTQSVSLVVYYMICIIIIITDANWTSGGKYISAMYNGYVLENFKWKLQHW